MEVVGTPPALPPQLGGDPPPLRPLRQNVAGSTRQRLKALSPVHRLPAAPRSPATRLGCWSLQKPLVGEQKRPLVMGLRKAACYARLAFLL